MNSLIADEKLTIQLQEDQTRHVNAGDCEPRFISHLGLGTTKLLAICAAIESEDFRHGHLCASTCTTDREIKYKTHWYLLE